MKNSFVKKPLSPIKAFLLYLAAFIGLIGASILAGLLLYRIGAGSILLLVALVVSVLAFGVSLYTALAHFFVDSSVEDGRGSRSSSSASSRIVRR